MSRMLRVISLNIIFSTRFSKTIWNGVLKLSKYIYKFVMYGITMSKDLSRIYQWYYVSLRFNLVSILVYNNPKLLFNLTRITQEDGSSPRQHPFIQPRVNISLQQPQATKLYI